MNEPFYKVNPNETEFHDKDGNLIPRISVTTLLGCYIASKNNKEIEGKITDELSDIFDMGSAGHDTLEMFDAGAKDIIAIEEKMKIMHESKKYLISGILDYYRFDLNGRYLEDLKSTYRGGFYYFLREGVKGGYKYQLSVYAYMKYVCTSIYPLRGVIRKFNKENYLEQIRLSTELFQKEHMRTYLTTHPYILYTVGAINYDALCAAALKENIATKSQWRCKNCQYNPIESKDPELCPIFKKLHKGDSEW